MFTTRRQNQRRDRIMRRSITAQLTFSTRAFQRGASKRLTSSHSAEGSQSSSRWGRPKSTSELMGLVLGCSLFPVSVYWMTKDDAAMPPSASPAVIDAPAFDKMKVTPTTKPQLGGPFTLLSSRTGKLVTDEDVFNGKWTLLYFGFSKCAEICPNTLKFIAELMKEADRLYGKPGTATEKEVQNLQTVFLSIDYIRDTPDVVEKFILPFDDAKQRRIVGLCGTKEQVEGAAHAWRVYFSSYDESEEEKLAREAKGIPLPELSDAYQFDHSSAIYLVGPDGKMKDFFFREIGVPNTADRLGLHFQDVYGIN